MKNYLLLILLIICFLPGCQKRSQTDSEKTPPNIIYILADDYGYGDIIEGITMLASRNQIDFTGSAKFHPLLPLIPKVFFIGFIV